MHLKQPLLRFLSLRTFLRESIFCTLYSEVCTAEKNQALPGQQESDSFSAIPPLTFYTTQVYCPSLVHMPPQNNQVPGIFIVIAMSLHLGAF